MALLLGNPNEKVWDAEKNQALAKSDAEGIIDTKEKRTIEKLLKAGYKIVKVRDQSKFEEVAVAKSETELDQKPKGISDMDWPDIQKKASLLGLEVKGKTKVELIKEIEGKVN